MRMIHSLKRLFLLGVLLCTICSTQAELKYIFYFIGDGMGPCEVLATEMYQAELEGKIGRSPLCMTQFPFAGMLATYSASNGVTDSSAAGTALACGEKTNNHTVGLNAAGDTLTSIAEALQAQGWAVGVTTSVSIDHATPASFYANSLSRNDYYQIGTQLVASNFDFFGGSAFKRPTNKENPAAPSLYALLREHDYTLAHGYADYQKKSKRAKKMVLINHNEGLRDDQRGPGLLPYALDKTEHDLTLPQITDAAIHFLSQHKRFFLMTEGGAIDWAGHSNDGAAVIAEVQEFDQSIRRAYEFYLQHPDETLIVVTADHETGGLVIGNGKYELNLKVLQHQTMSVDQLSNKMRALYKEQGDSLSWEAVRMQLTEALGFYQAVEITPEEEATLQEVFARSKSEGSQDVKKLYSNLSELADVAVRILNDKSVLGWTSGSHSATPVPLFAVGVGAERFSGWHDNTELKGLMLQLVNEK